MIGIEERVESFEPATDLTEPGAGPPLDQAAELRAAVRASRTHDLPSLAAPAAVTIARPVRFASPVHVIRSARVIAIASGKGGVGKTHLAVNVAICLGRFGRRVLLMDLDAGTTNADVLLNLNPLVTLGDYLSGRCSPQHVIRDIAANVKFIPGPSADVRHAEAMLADRQRLGSMIDVLSAGCDTVVLDCGAGVGPIVRSIASQADLLVVVTTPEPTAIADAYALLKVVHLQGVERTGSQVQRPGPTPLVVVNQAESFREAQATTVRIQNVASRFLRASIASAGWVRADKHVPQAAVRRQPVVNLFPRSRAAYDLSALAARLDAMQAGRKTS